MSAHYQAASILYIKKVGLLFCFLMVSILFPLMASADPISGVESLQNETILNTPVSGQATSQLLERRLKELEPDDPLLKTPAEMVKAEIQRREERRGQVAIPVKDEELTESERKKRDSRRALRLLTIINDMPKEHTETAESLIRAFFDVPEEKPDIRND